MSDSLFRASDWGAIRLVVFDVDGTLYRQRSLRWRIGRDLLLHSASRLDLRSLRVLRAYRQIREQLGDLGASDFEPTLIEMTAKASATPALTVRDIVAEWIDRRPLAYLRACRYDGLDSLFTGLALHGKSIGVLSDYPAQAKLAALDLRADYIVSACDADVACLKPQPRGLQKLLALAGVTPQQTVLIGDRADRDGEVARRIGVQALLRSSANLVGWQTFARFDDALFAPLRTDAATAPHSI